MQISHARRAAGALWLASATSLAAQPLPRSTPERQGIASSDLLSFVRAADSLIDGMHGLVVVRHGHVVAEGWWAPYDARTPHVLYSLSKSFTSTAIGLAAAEGRLSVDDPVLRWFPESAPANPSPGLRAMRVRDLLRMNTGHQSEPAFWAPVTAERPRTDSTWVQRFLAHPVPFKPGTHFLYNTPATYMLSAIVQKATGQTTLDYLRPRLFEPLGIDSPRWGTNADGVTLGGYGLDVRTEDVARFGQLYLQRGMWNGRRLLPAAWVDEATAMQTSNGSSPTSDWDQGYGYQFWRSRHGYRGDGAFGQYLLVLPEVDAVIAINSGVRDMQAVMNLVWDRLLPAMRPEPLPEDAAAQRALAGALAALRVRMPRGRLASPLARRVSRGWYELAPNEAGLRAIRFDLAGRSPALLVRTAHGETRTGIGFGSWARGATGFSNGLERMLAVPVPPQVAASAAWTSDSTLVIGIVTPETPFHSTMTVTFSGDRVAIDSEHNVSFGSTRQPRLEGRRVTGR